ncbi:MAG: glycosyltransferase [Planctomycetes bacterium]|nr:glycosyltransferase [Planctomycetota bacterium]
MSTFPPAKQQQVQAFLSAGQYDRAVAELQKLIRAEPKNPYYYDAMAVVLIHKAEHQKSLYYSETASKLAPQNPHILTTYGNTLGQLDQLPKAEEIFRRVLAIDHNWVNAWQGLGSVLKYQGRFREAEEAYGNGLRTQPDNENLISAKAGVMLTSGRPAEAIAFLEDALKRVPHSHLLAAMISNASNYIDGMDPARVAFVHRRFGEVLSRAYRTPVVEYPQTRDASRRIRIGLLSADMRRHSVAFFIEPLLRFADRTQFEIVVYSTTNPGDDFTERLKKQADLWRDCRALSDNKIAMQVWDDHTDILIDLHGHTVGHRLGVLHNRPAPVQATYCGYPHSTGLAAVGHRIVDALTDPPGLTDPHYIERLERMDGCFLCYAPPPPDASPEPSIAPNRPLTFGSFNSLQKVTDRTVALWSRVVLAHPGSRLLLKTIGLDDAESQQRTRDRLAAAGVDPSRLVLHTATLGLREHLDLYSQMDIALDTFPYHGTTTTCEAIFMGLPVVVLEGQSHASRVGVSLLTHLGHPEWIARDETHYQQIASALAADASGRAALRSSLRSQLLASTLCNGQAWCRDFERVLRHMWASYCNQPSK